METKPKCDLCKGTGEVPSVKDVTLEDGTHVLVPIKENCPKCKGTGQAS